jgi:hypothetical protein
MAFATLALDQLEAAHFRIPKMDSGSCDQVMSRTALGGNCAVQKWAHTVDTTYG